MKKILVALLVAMLALIATAALAECEHESVDYVVVSWPACEKTGEAKLVCVACNAVVETIVIPAEEHVPGTVDKQAETCMADGYRKVWCYECGELYIDEVYKKYDHQMEVGRVIKPDTCTEVGYVDVFCIYNCGTNKSIPVDEIKDHNWDLVKKTSQAPTCTEPGWEDYVCKRCNATKKIDLPANGHAWTQWHIEDMPTCTEPGFQVRFCNVCTDPMTLGGVRETQILPAKGHEIAEETIADGYGYCRICSAKVAVKEAAPEVKPEANKPATKPSTPNKPTTNNSGVTIPATGETMNVAPFIMMLVAIVGLAVTKQKVTE